MAARQCPHCGVKTNFTHKTDIPGKFGNSEEKHNCSFAIQQCQNCGGLILIHFMIEKNKPREEIFVYPSYIPKTDESIFPKASIDFIEGVRCAEINANKASATMFRRSLQQIMIDKNAQGNRLIDQIKDLQSRNIITTELSDWAHEIRFLGNDGAHPSNDGLDEITSKEIDEIIEFINSLFQYIYIMPKKVLEAKTRRSNKETT